MEDLYHYYDASTGPFRNLSDLEPSAAECVLDEIRVRQKGFASKRDTDYLAVRRELELRARELFVLKGGKPVRSVPHYMTLGPCPWLLDWYERGSVLHMPVAAFDPATISFTYGDLFPAMRYRDGKKYRGIVYPIDEIEQVIGEFGFPQQWNPEGRLGPERYIEVQVWDDAPIRGLSGA